MEATAKQLKGNTELMHLCTILGLDFDKSYPDGPDETLRYGKVMLMADQDSDGSHIKGLVINFFEYFWTTLFTFLDEFPL